jgi:hypothetical protein
MLMSLNVQCNHNTWKTWLIHEYRHVDGKVRVFQLKLRFISSHFNVYFSSGLTFKHTKSDKKHRDMSLNIGRNI